MKMFILSLALLGSVTAQAFTEVECSGRNGADNIQVVVDSGFGPNSWRNATVVVRNAEGGQNHRFSVLARGGFGNRVNYQAAGFDLEVDFWPDARPQWARTYRGTFQGSQQSIPFTMMWCRFPNVRP